MTTHAQTYAIKGMHCASCAAVIEKTLKKEKGVATAEANYGTESVKVAYDPMASSPEAFNKALEPFGYSLLIPKSSASDAAAMGMSEDEHAAHMGINQSKEEKLKEISALRTKVYSAIPLAIIASIVMAWEILAEFGKVSLMPGAWEAAFSYMLPIMATYMLFVVGTPYLMGVYRFVRKGAANMDTLIGIGTLAAYIYSLAITVFEEALAPYLEVAYTYYDVAIVVIAFITLGKYLEARSKIKTGDAIEKLLGLQAKTALVVRDGVETEVPIQSVVHGDIIIVKPGGKIPVDGVVTEGNPFIDESMVTGEPMPVEKNPGESVVAGTFSTTGAFRFKATKVGSETLLSNIIAMVAQAQGSKAPIQALADRISAVFVPIVLVISVLSLGAWLLIGSQYMEFSQAFSYGLVSFVAVLVIACPCALGLATPTAIIVGVGKGAREGILVKDAATLEKLHKVDTVVVDKTGTITKGKPELVSVRAHDVSSGGMKENDIVSVLASLEANSEHPIAHAIIAYAKTHGIKSQSVEKFEIIKGKGVRGSIGGREYFAGNAALIAELGIALNMEEIHQETREGKTPVMLAEKGKLLGIVMVADALKPEARNAVAALHTLGIKVVMLSGDDKNTARYIADLAGIDQVFAEVLPQDKLLKIKELQGEGRIVAMAGDGVNDAPALAQADVGIAMATGNDIAIESAGITLLHGDISKLVKSVRLSKLTMRGIKQNLFWAFAYNVVGIPLAAGVFFPLFGWMLNPIFAGFAMALSSVSVVMNSLRIKIQKI